MKPAEEGDGQHQARLDGEWTIGRGEGAILGCSYAETAAPHKSSEKTCEEEFHINYWDTSFNDTPEARIIVEA